MKRMMSVLLALVLCAGCLVSAGAAEATWEEKINALTLHPVNPADITGEDAEFFLKDYNRYASLVQPGMTNYQILQTVYDYVVQNYRTNTLEQTNLPGYFQCTAYAHELCRALTIVGFDVRYMTGECTVKGGGWTAHAWSAIRVNGELLYFDANIPAEHGGNASLYFAAVPGNTSFYRDAQVKVFEISPDLRSTAIYPEGEARPDWLDW